MRKTATEASANSVQGSLERFWDPSAADATKPPAPFQPRSHAILSACSTFRYLLERQWRTDAPTVLWVMLNPSTADAAIDDPTIRKVRLLSDLNGFGEALVVNLFAYRATDPWVLRAAYHPVDGHASTEAIVGADNDAHIRAAARRAKWVVAAWGNPVPQIQMAERIVVVRDLLKDEGHLALWALKLTARDEPGHPLYLANDTPFELEAALRRKARRGSEKR